MDEDHPFYKIRDVYRQFVDAVKNRRLEDASLYKTTLMQLHNEAIKLTNDNEMLKDPRPLIRLSRAEGQIVQRLVTAAEAVIHHESEPQQAFKSTIDAYASQHSPKPSNTRLEVHTYEWTGVGKGMKKMLKKEGIHSPDALRILADAEMEVILKQHADDKGDVSSPSMI